MVADNILTIVNSHGDYTKFVYDLGSSSASSQIIENWSEWERDRTQYNLIRNIINDLFRLDGNAAIRNAISITNDVTGEVPDVNYCVIEAVRLVSYEYESKQEDPNNELLSLLISFMLLFSDKASHAYRVWSARLSLYE